MKSTRIQVAAVAALLFLAAAPSGSAAAAAGRIASGCSIPSRGEHLGPTYLTSLSVSGTSCSTGLKVVREYHNCQLKHGGVKAKCPSRVDGYACLEKRGPSIPTEFVSSVSCVSGSKRVSYKYTQFT